MEEGPGLYTEYSDSVGLQFGYGWLVTDRLEIDVRAKRSRLRVNLSTHHCGSRRVSCHLRQTVRERTPADSRGASYGGWVLLQ